MAQQITLSLLEHTLLIGGKSQAELPDFNGNLPICHPIPARRRVSVEEFWSDVHQSPVPTPNTSAER